MRIKLASVFAVALLVFAIDGNGYAAVSDNGNLDVPDAYVLCEQGIVDGDINFDADQRDVYADGNWSCDANELGQNSIDNPDGNFSENRRNDDVKDNDRFDNSGVDAFDVNDLPSALGNANDVNINLNL